MTHQAVILWADKDIAAALLQRYLAEPEAGWAPTTVAAALGGHRSTVQQWLKWYREGGWAAVCRWRKGGVGKPSYLTKALERQVVAEAVRDWLEVQFGVADIHGSIYTLLPRLEIQLKMPRRPQKKPLGSLTVFRKSRGLGLARAWLDWKRYHACSPVLSLPMPPSHRLLVTTAELECDYSRTCACSQITTPWLTIWCIMSILCYEGQGPLQSEGILGSARCDL